MNENTSDCKGLNSSSHNQVEFESDSNKQGPDPPVSSPLERTLEAEEDYDKVLIQEEEASENQVKEEELLSSSPSSDKLEKEKKINKCFKSTIKGFCAGYCEVSTVACLFRQKWALLLSVLICSKLALEEKNLEILVPRLFSVSYCCLIYQTIEKTLQYRILRKTTNFRNVKAECLFELTDKALIMVFALILNLQYYKLINACFLFLPPLLFLLAFLMYRKYSGSQDDIKIIAKIVYVLQSFIIALKMTNILDLQWKITLAFLLVYLSIKSLYGLLASVLLIALCLTFFITFDFQTFRVLRNRILGYIWHIGYSLVDLAGLITLLGFFDKIGSNEDETLEWGLEIAKNLSFFLVVFSGLLFPILKKVNSNLFHDIRTALQNQLIGPKKYAIVKTEEQRREAFFFMISSTYFSQLRDISQAQYEEMIMQKNDIENSPQNIEEEGNLCYVCENHVSNAILGECGHGGVCCECALKLLEQKNECMGCREPATAIYKIENCLMNSPEAIVKAHEFVEIFEIESNTER